MLLTTKIKHSYDFSDELAKAREVAEFAVAHRVFSTKHVKHSGLQSIIANIANQILRKYSKQRKAKTVQRVKLTIPKQGIKQNKQNKTLVRIPSLL